MTEQHDTREAVMHLVGMLPDWRGEGPSAALDAALTEAAAMLRRVLAQRDAAESALATARADALRDAADRSHCRIKCDACVREQRVCRYSSRILSLIPAQETQHDR